MALNLSYSLADQDFHHTKSLGVWNVSTQLLQHLAAHPDIGRLTVFTNNKSTSLQFPANALLEEHNQAAAGRFGRVFWDQWDVYSAAKRSGNPWLFLPKGFAPVFRRPPVRVAAYVHDAMHDYYRRTYKNHPLAREAGYFTRALKATLRNADIIFTNTEFTRTEVQRLAREWNLPPPRLVHVGVGFDAPPLNHTTGPRRRIAVLASPWPHKCTNLAIERLPRVMSLLQHARHHHGDARIIGARLEFMHGDGGIRLRPQPGGEADAKHQQSHRCFRDRIHVLFRQNIPRLGLSAARTVQPYFATGCSPGTVMAGMGDGPGEQLD